MTWCSDSLCIFVDFEIFQIAGQVHIHGLCLVMVRFPQIHWILVGFLQPDFSRIIYGMERTLCGQTPTVDDDDDDDAVFTANSL